MQHIHVSQYIYTGIISFSQLRSSFNLKIVYITVSSYMLSSPVNPGAPDESIVQMAKRHQSFNKCRLNIGKLGIMQSIKPTAAKTAVFVEKYLKNSNKANKFCWHLNHVIPPLNEDKLRARHLKEREKCRNESPEQKTTIGYNHRLQS